MNTTDRNQYNAHGQKHGYWEEIYGSSPMKGHYVNGKKHGRWTEGWSGGEYEYGPYINGLRHGDWVEQNGSLFSPLGGVVGKVHMSMAKGMESGPTTKAVVAAAPVPPRTLPVRKKAHM